MKTIYSILIVLVLLSPGISFGADQCIPANANQLTIAEVQDYEQIAHCNMVREDSELEYDYSIAEKIGNFLLAATYLVINVAAMRQ